MPVRLMTLALAFWLALADRGNPCSYCSALNFQQRLTLRENARLAKFIVFGTLKNARLDGEKGLTDFCIDEVVRPDASLGTQKILTIPNFIPGDPKNPQRYLLFGEFVNGKLDIVHARKVPSAEAVNYLKSALLIDERDRLAVLQNCYRHLDSADTEVAEDAFHELAKASDREIALVAPRLGPDKFRQLLKDPKTSADRLGIFAYLLGACGKKEDAELLITLIRKNDERANGAMGGLLGGLIELRPDVGWATLQQVLGDPKRPFADKLNAHATLRFFQANKAKDSKQQILLCVAALVEQGDLADLAIEDLRRWHWWDLTRLIVAQYGKATHAAPIVRRAMVRYALCCPDAEAAEFVKARRLADPKLVQTVEESLEFEKPVADRKVP